MTLNGHVGVDADLQSLETIVEWAAGRGLVTGIVTTASLPHATPRPIDRRATNTI